MTDALAGSGQTTALVLVGLALLAIPTGLALTQGMSTTPTASDSVITPLPPLNLTATPTETSTTPTETPPQGNATTVVVQKDGPVGGGTQVECDENYETIQQGVSAAKKGDTVVVCGASTPYAPPSTIEIDRANLTLVTHGDVVIQTTGQTVIRTTGRRVTIRGFTFDHTVPQTNSQRFAIEVGGKNTVVRNNSFSLTGNSSGIFLSDGLIHDTGEPNPTLGPATGSRVINNTIDASDQTRYGVFTDADRTLIQGNLLFPRRDQSTISIRSSGNRTIIRENTIEHQNPCRSGLSGAHCRSGTGREAILVGSGNNMGRGASGSNCHNPEPNSEVTTVPEHNWAQNNKLINNYVNNSLGPVRFAAAGNYSKIFMALRDPVVKNNTLHNTGGFGIFAKGATIRNNTLYGGPFKSGERPPSRNPEHAINQDGICLMGNQSSITSNHIAGQRYGLLLGGSNLIVKNNVIMNNGGGIRLVNPLSGREYNFGEKPAWHAKGNRVINNTIINAQGSSNSVLWIKSGTKEVAYNRIANSAVHNGFGGAGIRFEEDATEVHHNTINNISGIGINVQANITSVHHNNITNNQEGVRLSRGPQGQSFFSSEATFHISEFHHNIIDNNRHLGINRENFDKNDGEWPIFNATHNIWGCGGPSGGLRDPYTNRTANGSGDGLSAGDKVGVSNIHFDPFFVREDVTCPAGMAQPTSTSTSTPTITPTSTPTPTLTSTPTPTPTPAAGLGNGTGGTGGNGTGGTGEGTGDTGPSGEPSTNSTGSLPTVTPPQSTKTPTPPPTPTISPTPRVEPGFGVIAWLMGMAILVTLVGVRRGRNTGREENNE